MRAMVLHKPGEALVLEERPRPEPGPGQVLIRVHACGVCRTDLHVVDGDLPPVRDAIVPGHETVGVVAALGEGVEQFREGERVGVPWLGWTCGECEYCRSGRENLCGEARFTGYHIDGGYADYALADQRYVFHLPDEYSDVEAAPLLCAGLIGHRSLQVARYEGREIYGFSRPGDAAAQDFARTLGAVWAGGSDEAPPEELDAAIIFAPVGALVPAALRATARGGMVVCAGIHMSDIPAFPYEILWGERTVRSVANLTRKDGEEFLALAPKAGVRTHTRAMPLENANEALADLREGRIEGAAVLVTQDC
jgi:propanol-preferring alcohol dehydrogenase